MDLIRKVLLWGLKRSCGKGVDTFLGLQRNEASSARNRASLSRGRRQKAIGCNKKIDQRKERNAGNQSAINKGPKPWGKKNQALIKIPTGNKHKTKKKTGIG